MTLSSLTCWIITEGMAGTQNQCVAVAEALGLDARVITLSLREPWRTLTPYLGFEHAGIFSPALASPWPDILITSGRKSIAASRYIKKQSGGKTFTVHIQDPRINPAQFDLVALPAHDPTRGRNVITTLAAPNRITDQKLDEARVAFAHFAESPAPRVAVLIGGSSKAHTLTPAITQHLAQQLAALDASLMITASRRTGKDNLRILQDTLAGCANSYIWDGSGENPYFGMLAHADYILVTADSTSMLSDAATTGKPVYMIPLEGGGKRIDALHSHLKQAGIVREFSGALESWNYPPLREAALIAEEIKKRLITRA